MYLAFQLMLWLENKKQNIYFILLSLEDFQKKICKFVNGLQRQQSAAQESHQSDFIQHSNMSMNMDGEDQREDILAM